MKVKKVNIVYRSKELTKNEEDFFNDFLNNMGRYSIYYSARSYRMVYKVKVDGRSFFVKYFKGKSFLERLKLRFGMKTPLTIVNLRRSFNLESEELRSIKPIFVGSYRNESYSVTRDCLELGYEFVEDSYDKYREDQLDYFIRLINKNIYFSDFHEGNYVIKEGKPYLLDIDDVRFYKTFNRIERNEMIYKYLLDESEKIAWYKVDEIFHKIWDNIPNNEKKEYEIIKELIKEKRENVYNSINWRG